MPDGTEIVSRHRHDYVEHRDANGETYAVDGGRDYLRRPYGFTFPHTATETSQSFKATDPFNKIRYYLEWGSYGKDGNEPLHYIALGDMETSHIEAVVETQELGDFVKGCLLIELALRSAGA
jgi:hypothetical protein